MTTARRYAVLDSTNAEALRLAAAGVSGPLWIVAVRQTAGRGRRGRNWASAPGNLYATLLRPAHASPAADAQLSFVAALAVADMLDALVPATPVRLKWPNDVLLDGKKVAGILLEAEAGAVAVGIGVNLAHHPAETAFPAISVAAVTGWAPGAETALTALAGAWDRRYDTWHRRGFAPVRQAWLERAAGLGDRISARTGIARTEGVFESLDADGALLVRGEGGLTRITAGDVFFGA